MRRLIPFLLLFVSVAAEADVRVMTTADGKKVIYNVGGPGRLSDYQWLARMHDRRSQFDPIIERYASQYRVDPVLVRAVIQVESNFNPGVVSHKGARGLMQLMPGTARRYGVSEVHDPDQNIRGGIRYLADLMEMFGGDLTRALAAYNAGEGAVTRYGGVPPYEETSTYVKRALTVYYGRPHGGAMTFAPRPNGKRLRGGFSAAAAPVAAIPGLRYLGSR